MSMKREFHVGRRLLSLVLCAAMVLSMAPVPSFAAESCTHHPEHTAECGYVEAVAGQPCAHQHDASCGYQEAAGCGHVCGDGLCGYVAAQPCLHVCGDNLCGYQAAVGCSHVCGEACVEGCAHVCGDGTCSYQEGRGCDHVCSAACGYQAGQGCDHVHSPACGYREYIPCGHTVHDASCGYAEAVAGQDCMFVCEICAGEPTVPENTVPENTVPENTVPDNTVPENTIPENTVPENTVPENTVPENTVPENTVPENTIPEDTIPEDTIPEETLTEETEPELCVHGVEEDCALCRIQELLDKLPDVDSVNEENALSVKEQLAAVEALLAELTEEKRSQLDCSRYLSLCDYFAALEEAPLVITAWEWIDEEEFLDEETGGLALPGASRDYPATFDIVVSFLPIEILVTVGGEAVTLELGQWHCQGYPVEGAYEGEYAFEATLPEGYILEEGVKPLTVDVLLGGAQMLSTIDSLTYLDANGNEKTARNVTVLKYLTEDTELTSGWYLLTGSWTLGALSDSVFETKMKSLTISGDVHLILDYSSDVLIYGDIIVPGGSSLTIYGRQKPAWNGDGSPNSGAGHLKVNLQQAFGNVSCIGKYDNCGSITINGGFITAIGSLCLPIGGKGGSVTINNGSVRTSCEGITNAIGGTQEGSCSVQVNGGYLTAEGYSDFGNDTELFSGIEQSSFATGTNGSAIIFTNKISDQSNKANWKGIIFEKKIGLVYGDQTLKGNLTIPSGYTLTIPAGTTLRVPAGVNLVINGTLINNGTLVNDGSIQGEVTGNPPKYSASYLDTDGKVKTVLCENNGTSLPAALGTSGQTTWYAVSGTVNVDSRVSVTGDVRLILTEGCTLNANRGIQVNDNDSDITNGSANSLTIYAQSTGGNTGKLTATASGSGEAAIGGGNGSNSGVITINGGKITASSTGGGAGIGGGENQMANVTINGGSVNASGSQSSAGIGNGGYLTINGGTVIAQGGSSGSGTAAGIGGSATGSGGFIVIGGGSVNDGLSGDRYSIGGGSNGTSGIVFNRSSTATITQTQSMPFSFTIDADRTLNIAQGAAFTLPSGVTGTINSTLSVKGTLNAQGGKLVSNGKTYIDGSLTGNASGNLYYPLRLTDVSSDQIVTYSGSTYALKGSTVTLKLAPPTGYALSGWEITPTDVVTITETYSFTMPDKAVSIRALYLKAVASVTIGSTKTLHPTLSEAFAKAKDQTATITLLGNTTTAECVDMEGADIQLDLNGFTWTSETGAFCLKAGKLTISDSSTAKSGFIRAKGASTVSGNTTLLIEGGSFDLQADSADGLFTAENNCEIRISGGEFKKPVIMNLAVAFKWAISGNPTFTDFRISGFFGGGRQFTGSISGGTFQKIGHFVRYYDGSEVPDSTLVNYNSFTLQNYLSQCLGFYSGSTLVKDRAASLTNVTVGIAHSWEYPNITESVHTRTCAVCYQSTTVAHIYDGGSTGICECGAAKIPYLNAAGTQQAAVFCKPAVQNMTGGWYVVSSDMTFPERITVTGNTHLILANGLTLTADRGIQVVDNDRDITNGSSNSLTIYCQTTDETAMGTLIATSVGGNAAIGGNDGNEWNQCGVITINGGKITAASTSDSGAGIGGDGANITINAGFVSATGSGYGPGIGSGYVTINGGTVYAKGGHSVFNNVDAADIGASAYGDGGFIVINGGTVSRDASGTPCTIGAREQGYSGIVFNKSTTARIEEGQYLQVPSTIDAGRTLIVEEGVLLGIPNGITLTINGTLEIKGTLDIMEGGKLIVNGKVYVDGSFSDELLRNLSDRIAGNVYFSLSVNNGKTASQNVVSHNGKTYAKMGGAIQLIPQPSVGQILKAWNSTPEDLSIGTDNRFTMPAQVVSIQGKYADIVAAVTINGVTTNYFSIDDAFTAANGQTAEIALKTDTTAANTLTVNGGSITFSCGGHTLTGAIQLLQSGTLKISDGTIRWNEGIVINVSNYSRLELTDAKIESSYIYGNNGAVTITDSSSLDISGNTLINSGTHGIVLSQYSQATIKSGTIRGRMMALSLDYSCRMTLSGGIFESEQTDPNTSSTIFWIPNYDPFNLILHNLTEGLADGYGYLCSNGSWLIDPPESGYISSLSGKVQVLPIPAIVTQPTNTSLKYGEEKSLTFAANSSGFSYQWYRVTTNGDSTITETAVEGATESSLPLSNLPVGSYQFRCKATLGDRSLESQVATVTVGRGTPTLAVTPNLEAAYSGAAYRGIPFTVSPAELQNNVQVIYKQNGQVVTPVDAGTYTVELTLPEGANYSGKTARGTLKITPKTIGIQWSSEPLVYNGAAQAPTAAVTGTYSRDTVSLTVDGQQTNAGENYTATVTGITGTGAGNYVLPSAKTTSFSIQKRPLTVTDIQVADKQYDGLNTAKIVVTPGLDGLVDADKDKVQLTNGTPTFKTVAVGKDIPIVFSAFSISGSSNYVLTQPTGITASIYNSYTPKEGTDYTASSNGWIGTDFQVAAMDGFRLSLTNTAEDGNWVNTLTVTQEGTGKLVFYVRNTATGAISPAVTEDYQIDKTAPTGSIFIGKVDETAGKDSVTRYRNQDVSLTITGSDDRSGIASVSYYRSADELNPEEVEATDWTAGTSITIQAEDNTGFLLYAKVVDNAGNVTYCHSNQFVFDTTFPSVTGVVDKNTYYTTQTVKVEDANLKSLTLNGTAVSSPITLEGNKKATYTIVATDQAGNTTAVSVTMEEIASLSAPVKDVTTDNVTKENKQALDEARSALEALLDTENKTEKEKAQEALNKINQALTTLANVSNVENQIDAFPTDQVQPDDEKAEKNIKQAREDYKALSDHEKELVDSKKLQKLEKLEAALVDYKFVAGNDSVWDMGSGQSLSFTANGRLAKLKEVKLDGETLDTSDYTKTDNRTTITLDAALMQNLSVDTHTIQLVYTDGETKEVSFEVKQSESYLDLTEGDGFQERTEVFIDGVNYPIEETGGKRYVNLPETGDLLTTFDYRTAQGDYGDYPTSMTVYLIDRAPEGTTVTVIPELNNLLQYSGCSIRITGNRGIRMITSIATGKKQALTGAGLAGFKLVEYGTVVSWKEDLAENELTLDTGKHNYAFKLGVADPVFNEGGGLTQYTNVLVGFDLAECSKDIVMRPYITLQDADGNQHTLYGGCVTRSISYIAWQNQNTYAPGTPAYDYVHELMALYEAAEMGGNES